jgi:hypothetical protein
VVLFGDAGRPHDLSGVAQQRDEMARAGRIDGVLDAGEGADMDHGAFLAGGVSQRVAGRS